MPASMRCRASLERNARHAAKVLLKFHLLEVREVSMRDADRRTSPGARYYPLINDRYFRMPFDAFVRQQVSELAARGAAVVDGDTVRDAGALTLSAWRCRTFPCCWTARTCSRSALTPVTVKTNEPDSLACGTT